jgi:hypothetical protein
MSGLIFKEVAFTPQVFDKSALLDDMRKFEKLLNAMDDLSESGIIVGVYSDWLNKITELIEKYDEAEKNDIQEVLKFLNDRQRIVFTPKNESFSDDEDVWISQAKKLSQIREFDLIIASKDLDGAQQINSLGRKTLKNKGAIVTPQSKENMTNILAPILGYAEIVKVMDPYFNPTKKRYVEALEIICQTLGNHHGAEESAIIDIHTSVKVLLDRNGMVDWKSASGWDKIIANFKMKYQHKISLYIWEDKKDDQWHDRWIITNQCGTSLGKGSDISEWTDATWGILDWNFLPNVEKKFIPGRDEFNLIAMIDDFELKKSQPLKQYGEYKTAEKIAEKQSTVIVAGGIRKKV